MEIEEMKLQWETMSKEVEQQKSLTDKIIMEMTEIRFKNKLQSIAIHETIGSIICVAMAGYVISNFAQLDTWYLMASGVFTIAYLLLLPFFILKSLGRIKDVNIIGDSHKQLLLDYANRKKQFYTIQKIGFYLNFVLIVTALPLAGKIISGKDLFLDPTIWFWYLPIMASFVVIFSLRGYKYYKKTTDEAGSMLKELDEG